MIHQSDHSPVAVIFGRAGPPFHVWFAMKADQGIHKRPTCATRTGAIRPGWVLSPSSNPRKR